ncbi:MAG: DUF116 domain-containing protein [Deltaproteobacteria bacterium]|nr:DUF116 domain-containing protein [Deltaproteobacteria bacterium]
MVTRTEEYPQKRVFLGLLFLTCVVLTVLAAALWWVPYVGLSNINKYLPAILAAVFGAALTAIFISVILLFFTVVLGRNIFFSKKLRGMVIKVIFPLMVVAGRLAGIKKEEVQRSFISINNQLVLAEGRKTAPEKLLLLMPHCLQFYECSVKITGRTENCKRCGRCKIKDLLDLVDEYHVKLAVATGGTIARRIVKEIRPEIIIGVACERDLASGIQDTYPLPVYGILNQRPFGPCFNTSLDLDLVRRAVVIFLNGTIHDIETSGPGDTSADREKAGDTQIGADLGLPPAQS